MNLVLTLLLSVFVYLFSFYLIAIDDGVFLRRWISNEHLFNIAFLLFLGAIFFSRFIYIVFHFQTKFLNPLVFLAVPYYPGLSLYGGMLGGYAFLFLYTHAKKINYKRLLDFLSFASFCAIAFGMVFYNSLTFHNTKSLLSLFFSLLFLLCFSVLSYLYLPNIKKSQAKEGIVGPYYLLLFSVLFFAFDALTSSEKLFWILGREDLLLLLFILLAFFLIVKDSTQKNRYKTF